MKCPNCGLINPDNAIRCDCGYDFPTGKVKEAYLDKKLSAIATSSASYQAKHLDTPNWFRLVLVLALAGLAFLLGLFLVLSTPGSIYAPGIPGYIATAGLGMALGSLVGIVVFLVVVASALLSKKTK